MGGEQRAEGGGGGVARGLVGLKLQERVHEGLPVRLLRHDEGRAARCPLAGRRGPDYAPHDKHSSGPDEATVGASPATPDLAAASFLAFAARPCWSTVNLIASTAARVRK